VRSGQLLLPGRSVELRAHLRRSGCVDPRGHRSGCRRSSGVRSCGRRVPRGRLELRLRCCGSPGLQSTARAQRLVLLPPEGQRRRCRAGERQSRRQRRVGEITSQAPEVKEDSSRTRHASVYPGRGPMWFPNLSPCTYLHAQAKIASRASTSIARRAGLDTRGSRSRPCCNAANPRACGSTWPSGCGRGVEMTVPL
jgi:hypothetical protein